MNKDYDDSDHRYSLIYSHISAMEIGGKSEQN